MKLGLEQPDPATSSHRSVRAKFMKYARRTFDEATELAREAFRGQVAVQLRT